MSKQTPDPATVPNPSAAAPAGAVGGSAGGESSTAGAGGPTQPPGKPHHAAILEAVGEAGQRLDRVDQHLSDAQKTVERLLNIGKTLEGRMEAMDKTIGRQLAEHGKLSDQIIALRKYVENYHPPARKTCAYCGRISATGDHKNRSCGGHADGW